MGDIDRLIKYIHKAEHPNAINIHFDKDFGGEADVNNLIDCLCRYRIVEVKNSPNPYKCVQVNTLPTLRVIINEFNGNFESYAKSLTEKEDFELDKLKFEKSIQPLERSVKRKTSFNLTLQNTDIIIKFLKWAIPIVILCAIG